MPETDLTPKPSAPRYPILDLIRGVTLINMIAYHGLWNLVYLGGFPWAWYTGAPGHLWQQAICWSFILLSGFCWPLGKRPLRRGLTVFGSGILVSLVTLFFLPDLPIRFGVLTLLGSSMLLMIPLAPLLRRVSAGAGLTVSMLLFLLTRAAGRGYLALGHWQLISLPDRLYQGPLGAFLGFTPAGFSSSDYFPLIPWFFLFCAGWFLFPFLHKALPSPQKKKGWQRPFLFLGRQSLPVYLLHQPALFGLMSLLHLI